MKARSLQDLPAVARALAERRTHAAALAQRQAEALVTRQASGQHVARNANAAPDLFALAVGPVKALRHKAPANLGLPKAEPVARMLLQDERSVLRESLSDGVDAATLLETDERLSYRSAGVGPDVLRKLRSGHWSVQGQIDLHGLRAEEARDALGQFLRKARADALRCLRVVHGKGLGSPGRTPVLKALVRRWLMQKQEVMAYVQARPADGGAGAVLVLLRSGD
jgi:DNA-nicking Smr family endonuclease